MHNNCTRALYLSTIRDICDFKAVSLIDTVEKKVVL
jgi:hypothetical protein